MEDINNNLVESELATVPTDGPIVQEDEIHRVLDETSNANILNHGQADYPPCLKDIYLEPIQTSNVLKRMIKVLDSEVVQRIGQRPEFFRQDLQMALYQTQLFSGLPDRTSQSRHIYVVTQPHIPFEVSRFHWSVYSQGYFYHLSARLPKNPTEQSACLGLEKKTPRAQISLKIEDLSTTDSGDYVRAVTEASSKPFVAYEMGCTQYDPEQLQTLAQWIITRLGTYDLLTANCQVFAMSLVDRAVMTARDCSAFVGNKTQLVDWDLRARHNDDVDQVARNPYDFAHGYLVRKPRIRRGWSFRTRRPFFVLFPIPGTKLRAIRRLYENGPSTSYMPKMDPTGKHGLLTYPFVQCKWSSHFHTQWLQTAVRELGEDLVARRWGDAFRGRKETRDRFKALSSEARGLNRS
jgi:hypothetical protein